MKEKLIVNEITVMLLKAISKLEKKHAAAPGDAQIVLSLEERNIEGQQEKALTNVYRLAIKYQKQDGELDFAKDIVYGVFDVYQVRKKGPALIQKALQAITSGYSAAEVFVIRQGSSIRLCLYDSTQYVKDITRDDLVEIFKN